MTKAKMLEKLERVYRASVDIMVCVSQLESALYHNDDDGIKKKFAHLKELLKILNDNIKEESNGYK